MYALDHKLSSDEITLVIIEAVKFFAESSPSEETFKEYKLRDNAKKILRNGQLTQQVINKITEA